jgi:putative transposase
VRQAQRLVTAHAAVSNLFNLGRRFVRAQHYRDLRRSAFSEWSRAVADPIRLIAWHPGN